MNYLTELTGDVSDFDCQLHDSDLVELCVLVFVWTDVIFEPLRDTYKS